MDDKETVIKHLEMIQGIINRLAQNSFLIKGWSMTILGAVILFFSKSQPQYIILCLLIPVIGFWFLDSYYLWQERLFRGVYNDVRKQDKTDFSINISAQKSKPKYKWHSSFISITPVIFYMIEIIFIGTAFFILNCK
ncbi:hypothetical protein P0082_03925 [Candidatus Haliotispira prima]|uniref:DUF3899 domain-containing protein n=1 Tax=Candidatus Haliotispira prima TaxID=3034016 RepID=A0ABY8MJ30_9SPIO|nr:hypothetical protein P0082_03925 [Candidatus Haliotispira prima]